MPPDVVRRRYGRSLNNFFDLYSTFADSWLMLDNSIEFRPRLIAKRYRKGRVKVFDAEALRALRDGKVVLVPPEQIEG